MGIDILVKDIFKEDISRPIQGVIQAGQQEEEIIITELKEYVMTDEGSKRMENFYKNYVATLDTQTDKMGVWISGFFGSGKSHFLKILSYLLGHKVVGGKSAYSYFENKITNKQLLELMKKVDESKSEAILFNIDSKTTTNATNDQKILDVFLKVFNQFLGYSATPWIADIERSLDGEGKFLEFKNEFSKLTNSTWEEKRVKLALNRKYFVNAMANVGYDEETSKNFLDSTKKSFSISSEDFAKMVGRYCKSKGTGYRLAFLIDEVGQYIGNNNDMMLNLQTVVEDLGNYTNGQAWVIVTSQEKVDVVKGDGFSKIQGRFATRLNLSSANADEVIKKRLLAKKDTEYNYLKAKFESQEQSINNKLMFDSNSTAIISGFPNGNEFAESYPFVPYQFSLLQDVFENVRLKGEAGKHLAHGERSLLNAFQEIAIRMKDSSTNEIAIFADFYDTIEKFLDSNVVKTISKSAGRGDVGEFEVKVLKALYMIKDIDYIKATLENITTLFIDNINVVKKEVEEKVVTSLKHLERIHLIEKLADETYRFLSDEEQEINNAIKKISVDDSKIKSQIYKALFDEIYKNKSNIKKTSDKSFQFNRKFDDFSRGSSIHELTLQVYSSEVHEAKALMDATDGQVVMLLPANNYAYDEYFTYCEQIEIYNRTSKSSITPSQKRIIEQKLEQSTDFYRKGREALECACKEAKYYIQGNEFTFTGDLNNQLERALLTLIDNTYTKLHYINTIIHFKQGKEKLLEYAKHGYSAYIDLTAEQVNSLAVDEITKFIDKTNTYAKKTVREIVVEYSKIPYGWNEYDILGVLCNLIFKNKVKFKYLGNLIEANNIQFIEKLMKIPEQEKLVVELEVSVPREVKSKALRFIKEYFGTFELGDTYDSIAKVIKDGIEDKMKRPLELIKTRQQKENSNYPYPGSMEIMKLQDQMEELIYTTDLEKLVKDFIELEDELDEWFETEEQLTSFYTKTPIEIFDKGVSFLTYRKEEIDFVKNRNSDVDKEKNEMENILKDSKPYKRIPKLELLIKSITEKISEEKLKEKQIQLVEINKIKDSLLEIENFYSENSSVLEFIKRHRRVIDDSIKGFESLDSFTSIMAISSSLNYQLNKLKNLIDDYIKELTEAKKVKEDDKDIPFTVKEKREISIATIINKVAIKDVEVDSLQGLDSYFENLKNLLKNELINELKEYDLIIKK